MFSPGKNLAVFETKLLSVTFDGIRKSHLIYSDHLSFIFLLFCTDIHLL